jgi:hypothetical protein
LTTPQGFDASQAYDVGIGEWDIASISWLYSQYPDAAAEAAGLESILQQARVKTAFCTFPTGTPAATMPATRWPICGITDQTRWMR